MSNQQESSCLGCLFSFIFMCMGIFVGGYIGLWVISYIQENAKSWM